MLKNNDFKSFLIGFLLAMVMMLMMGNTRLALDDGDTITIKHYHTNWEGTSWAGKIASEYTQYFK